jgi:hypothetical protein
VLRCVTHIFSFLLSEIGYNYDCSVGVQAQGFVSKADVAVK